MAVPCPPGTRPVGSLNIALVHRIREIPVSNLDLETGHSDLNFPWLSSVLPSIYRGNCVYLKHL
jgi:hypothetical protein